MIPSQSPEAPAGRSHDLTARVAASRAAGGTVDSPQILLVDDQPHQVLPWLERVLTGFTLLPVSGEEELDRLLGGQVLERLPPGPYHPVAALVDLDLGAGGGSGLGVIRRLRAHPAAACTTIILFTNGLAGRDDRDLLAVLAAYANGDGLLASTKDEPDGPRLRAVLAAAAATAAAGGVLSPKRSLGGLRYVPPLTLRSVHTQRPPCDLVELLLGEPGLRALWGHYADCGADFDEAVNRARDQFPGFLRRSRRAPRPGASPAGHAPTGRSHLANDLLTKRDFGELFLSWHLHGDSFLNVPGTVMEPLGLGSEEEYRQHSARRRLILGMFFARYGRLLMARETHRFAEAYIAEKGVR
ncbi:MAG: hypothetical protein JXA67_00945 [Micromonosporaceae bacterium]|nr:hypothetical protein [Micromonosporaceae bacterium]